MNSRLSKFCFFAAISFLLNCRPENLPKKNRVFHYNQPNPVTSLDPAFAKSQNNIWLIDHIYNQLLDLDDSMRLVPEIAKNWDVSDDGMKYIFHLRNDIFFHKNICFGVDSTRKLNSSDVEFSFKRLLDPALSAPGRWIFIDKLDSIKPFNIVDDSTIEVNLKKPFSPFLSLLTMQ